jgi:nitroreductase
MTIDMADKFDALLRERYSCRGFLPEPLSRDLITQIAAIAQRTPSWCNSQPWQLHVAGAEATARLREQMVAHALKHEAKPDLPWPTEYRGVYQERRRQCGLQLYRAVGVERGDRPGAERQRLENFQFFGAPHVAVISTDASLGVYGAVDCGAYVNNLMLAARSVGVASIAQAALAAYPDFWRSAFGLPGDRQIVCGLSLGREDTAHRANAFRTARADVGDALAWLD